MAHPPQETVQLPIDEISSPLGAHLEFSESELFPEILQDSGAVVASISSNNNISNEEHDHSSNPTDTTPNTNNNNRPVFFDPNDISASIDFSDPSSQSFSLSDHHNYFNNNEDNGQHALLFSPTTFNNNNNNDNNQISLGDEDFGQPYMAAGSHHYNPEAGLMMPTLPVPVPPYNNIYGLSAPFSFEGFTSGLFLGNEHQHHQEIEFQGDNIFHHDSARVFDCSTGDIQRLSSESQQQLLHGSPSTTAPASEASSLEDPNFTVPKLSAEERKMKIHRYLKKRNQRNFSKKIKYACRKTLADSRPRVRGRFAKNDELAEMAARASNGNNNRDEDTDDDFRFFSNPGQGGGGKAGKDEDDLESSDIFAHISGVNSFKCNYPIQSWI